MLFPTLLLRVFGGDSILDVAGAVCLGLGIVVAAAAAAAGWGAQTGHEIRRKIADQVHSARRAKRPNDPLIYDLLVPPDLAEVRKANGLGVAPLRM